MGESIELVVEGNVTLGPVTLGSTGMHLGDVILVESVEENRRRVVIALDPAVRLG